jgi:hypothetical protein
MTQTPRKTRKAWLFIAAALLIVAALLTIFPDPDDGALPTHRLVDRTHQAHESNGSPGENEGNPSIVLGSDRSAAIQTVEIRVRSASSDAIKTEILVVALTDDQKSALRRPYGLAKEALERLAVRHFIDSGASLSIPRPGIDFFVGARAVGTAPTVRWIPPNESAVDIELVDGYPFRIAAFDHSNQRVPGAAFEMYFDSRTTLETNPDVDIAQLALLPLFHSQATTAEDAVATVEHLAAGIYRVIARHPNFADGLAWGANVPMSIDPFIVSLEPRAFVDGFVRARSDRRPIEGARIEIRELVNGQWYGDSCSVLSGSDGYFACENAWGSPHGDLDGQAICWKDGLGVQVISVGFLKPGDQKRIEFLLDEAAPFYGRVEDLEGRPRGGVRLLALENNINLESTTTRADGTFTLHTLPKDFSFYLYASGADIAPVYSTPPTPWRADRPHVIQVESTFSLEGRVAVDRYPLDGARVRAALESNRTDRLFETWVTADPLTGVFRFEGLTPGRYYFDVVASGYSPRRIREIEIGGTQRTQSIEFRLERGCRIRGTVRAAATGAPIEGATVGIADFGEVIDDKVYGSIDLGVSTDNEGRFEIDSLEHGREAVLLIQKEGFARCIDRFDVSPAATLIERSIRMSGVGRLSVSVTRPPRLTLMGTKSRRKARIAWSSRD